MAWKRRAIGLGALAAVLSGTLAVLANLSEIAGWFAPDETRELVAQTRKDIQETEAKIESLVMLLRNQAAATGLNLDIESEAAIRNAIEAIIASGNAQKQTALSYLDAGDARSAAAMMARVASEQSVAANSTGEAAAETWRETGALYYGLDMRQAVEAYSEANRLQPGHPETLEMLGHSLLRTGRMDEAEETYRRVLALNPAPDPLVSTHGGLGNVAKLRGNYALAREHFARSLELAIEFDLPRHRIQAQIHLASLAREEGRMEEADGLLRDALERASAFADESLTARLLANLGTLEAARENFGVAADLLERALAIYRQRNDLGGIAHAIGNLGALALMRGDLDAAETLLLESVDIGRQLGWASSIVTDLINLGGIETARDNFEAADRYLGEAGALSEQHGLAELTPIIVHNRGDIARQRGDIETACRYWAEAEPQLAAMGSVHAETARKQLAVAECPGGAR